MNTENYYRQILETTPTGLIVISRNRTVREINRNAMAMFNIEEANVIGRLVDDVVPESARPALLAIVEETFDEGFAINEEMSYWVDTGLEIELGLTGSLVASVSGEPEAVVACRDMTARRELDRLSTLDRVKSDYVDKVAHELRNPLTTIQAYAETVASMVEGEPKEFLNTVGEECDRMMGLIKEMLSICRLESGMLKLTLADADLIALTEQCVRQVQAQTKQHKIVLSLATDRRTARIDEDKVKEVLLNLIENAVKYSPDGGTVAVTVNTDGEMLSVAVADSGIGIDDEHIHQLFEKFYRVDSPRTQGIAGTGLGLAIAKGIVDAHGGSITVTSEVGTGSIFTVSLPQAAAAPAESRRHP